MSLSRAGRLNRLPTAQKARLLQELDAGALAALLHDWSFWARPEQLPPQGTDWRIWLIMAGRGFGKTRAGAEWIRARAAAQPGARLALVASTYAEGRSVMIEGESGLLHVGPSQARPRYEPSLRRLRWKNGTQAFLYSAEDADGLRGPQHHAAWCDEVAKWPNGLDCWMNLEMGLRLGTQPQICATTTPRPTQLMRALLARSDAVTTRGRTRDNAAFLAPGFIRAVEGHYGHSRLGRQELDGEWVEQADGALWTRDRLDRCRRRDTPPLVRVVVGVDPPVSSGERADACGIIACGRDGDGHAHVLEDASVQGLSPDGWARAVVACARRVEADQVIAEANNGGELVRAVLHQVDPLLPVTLVRASQGKVARAEPVAALYEQQRVFHAADLRALEDELCGLCSGGEYLGPGRSPDRADALVWALTTLMLDRQKQPQLRRI